MRRAKGSELAGLSNKGRENDCSTEEGSMKEPTAEQIKTFWQRWGFREESIERAAMVDCGQTIWVVVYPDGGMTREGYPLLTSDNLFRWAVPKVFEAGFWVQLLGDGILGWDARIHHLNSNDNYSVYQDKELALALFWAIWQHIEKAA